MNICRIKKYRWVWGYLFFLACSSTSLLTEQTNPLLLSIPAPRNGTPPVMHLLISKAPSLLEQLTQKKHSFPCFQSNNTMIKRLPETAPSLLATGIKKYMTRFCSCFPKNSPPIQVPNKLPFTPSSQNTIAKSKTLALLSTALKTTARLGYMVGNFVIDNLPRTETQWRMWAITSFGLCSLYWFVLTAEGYAFRQKLFFQLLESPLVPTKFCRAFFSWAVALKIASPIMRNEAGMSILEKVIEGGDEELVYLFFNAATGLPKESREALFKEPFMVNLGGIKSEKIAKLIERLDLFKKEIDIKKRNTFNTTILHESVKANNVTLTELILKEVKVLPEAEKISFLNQLDGNKQSALHIAVDHKNKKDERIILALLEAGADTTSENTLKKDAPLFLEQCVKLNNPTLLERCLQKIGKNITKINSETNRTLLHTAIIHAHPENIRIILEYASEILPDEEFRAFITTKTKEGNSALFLFVLPKVFLRYNCNSFIESIMLLLSFGKSSINEQDDEGNTIFHILTRYLNAGTKTGRLAASRLEKLLKIFNAADLSIRNHAGMTAYDSCTNKAYLIAILCRRMNKEKINRQDGYGNTLLHYAAGLPDNPATGSFVDLLLNQGADPNSTNHVDETPLHIASRFKNQMVIQKLFSKGAHSGLKNTSGQTPEELLLTPLPKKIHFPTTSTGYTPLHFAAATNFKLFRKLYPNYDPCAENSKGENTLDIAFQYCNIPVIFFLKSAHFRTGSRIVRIHKPLL